jgi:hypothetical protein
MVKSAMNPKEKMRLKAIREHLSRYSHDPAAQRRIAISYSLMEAERMKRCRAVLGKGSVIITFEDRMLDYRPATGEILWAVHPAHAKIGEEASVIRATGIRMLGQQPAARLVYEAVHGPIDQAHEIYCVNNDPADLRILNLRTRDTGRIVEVPIERDRALTELARIKKERGL